MPDDDTHATLNEVDREPSTGQPSSPGVTNEHADLHHRLSVAPVDEAAVTKALSDNPEPVPIRNGPHAVATANTPEPVVPTTEVLPKAGPGLLVLQWLVYAFWGWTILALSGLVLLVVAQLLTGSASASGFGEGIAYPLAAAIVLFIIAMICDAFYARLEKRHARSGGTSVIMIIHAVLFALFGIGALIVSVFGFVSLLIGDTSSNEPAQISIISGFIIFIIYGVTLLRTLRPKKVPFVVPAYWAFMAVALISIVALSIIGPVAAARLQAEDRLIEEGLPGVANAINDYTTDNAALPKTLDDLTDSNQLRNNNSTASELIRSNKVEYTPGERIESTPLLSLPSVQIGDQLGGTVPIVYAYELCVTYKSSDGYSDSYSDDYIPEGQKYSTSVTTYGHPEGRVCYDVQTDFSN